MGSLTIRNVDDSIKAKLRMVAAMNERSMEEEAR
ncbi:FitA-like ribbon-helix-helix domain-containing protein [Desulfobacter hydrogenophilus]